MTTSREFEAWEYGPDAEFARAQIHFLSEDDERGWRVLRNGEEQLRLGEGYRLLEVEGCGICSTDLARRFLPFPLPQVIGHEVVLTDAGRRYVVEINASCRARGREQLCDFCALGLDTHCPERMVLGIDRLPGGFGEAVLAPREALLEVPASLPTTTALLVEPFAASLHAVETVQARAGDVVAVLGPRRLGMLVLAALKAWRDRENVDFEIVAAPRRAELGALALQMGADRVVVSPEGENFADIVIDTTGSPQGLDLALSLARREVHLKSTHGQAAGGLAHLTEFVVDELSLERAHREASPPSLCLTGDLREARRQALEAQGERERDASCRLGRAEVVLVRSPAGIDAAIRPDPGNQVSLLKPRGRILLDPDSGLSPEGASSVWDAVARRGLKLTASRCGDFRSALALLDSSEEMRGLGERFITHRFARADLPRAFETAAGLACIKAIVTRDGASLG
jgi:threonine dehydrogenase-like Zn-dependent dehydrogenase